MTLNDLQLQKIRKK